MPASESPSTGSIASDLPAASPKLSDRAAKTRRRLLDHGRVAFASKGHDGLNLSKDILKPSGVSIGSFYHQFNDKTDLLVAILTEAAGAGRQLAAASLPALPTPITERAEAHIAFWFDLIDGAEDIFRIQVRERNNPDERVRHILTGLRNQAIEQAKMTLAGEIPPELAELNIDVDLAADLISALLGGTLIEYLNTPLSERPAFREARTGAMARFILAGLSGTAQVQPPTTDSTEDNG